MSEVARFISNVQLIDRMIKSKTEGLSHEQSMKQLPFPGNCMNWNLGHILVYRMQYLGAIDGESQPDEAEFAIYGAGSDPLTDSAVAIPLPTLLQRLEDASQQVIAALESMPPDRLDQIYDEERATTVRQRLDFYVLFHESYHAGQLEPLRELALAG